MARWKKPPHKLITPHFHWMTEAACKHCGRVPGLEVVQETAEWLERLREGLGGFPLHVTSWCRCPVHNQAVGGAPQSYHVKGMAVDFVVRGLTLLETQKRCRQLWVQGKIGGLGIYTGWTHADRGTTRRWEGP